MAAGHPVELNDENVASLIPQVDYENLLNKINNMYGVAIYPDKKLSCEQIVDICYGTCKSIALQKVKTLIEEYDLQVSELFDNQTESIH